MEPPRQAGAGPRVQYAQTADGVSIAYTIGGDGEAVLRGFDDRVRPFESRRQE